VAYDMLGRISANIFEGRTQLRKLCTKLLTVPRFTHKLEIRETQKK